MEVRTPPAPAHHQHAVADARLALVVSGICVAALAVLLLTTSLPGGANPDWRPPGPDELWVLGSVFTILLGPVALGLCAWSSLVALWVRGRSLPDRARRLHLLTLVVAAAFAVTFAAAWAQGAFAWLRD